MRISNRTRPERPSSGKIIFQKNKNNACNFFVCMILYLGDSRLLRTFMPFN